MDGVHEQDFGLPVGDRVDLPDKLVIVQNGQGEVAPSTLGGGLYISKRVLEVEQLLSSRPVMDQPSNDDNSAVRPSNSSSCMAVGSTRHNRLICSLVSRSTVTPSGREVH
jgi:hypothetical protein